MFGLVYMKSSFINIMVKLMEKVLILENKYYRLANRKETEVLEMVSNLSSAGYQLSGLGRSLYLSSSARS